MSISLASADSSAFTDLSTVNLGSTNGASSAIAIVSTAIDDLASKIQDVGQYKVRLSSKEQSLSVASTNTEAIRSSVEDADFAQEQMEVMKLQILQQTAISSFSQANSAPQVVLSLFR